MTAMARAQLVLKQGARGFLLPSLPHACRGQSSWKSILCCFPRPLAEIWMRIGAAGTLTGAYMMLTCAGERLACWATMLAPSLWFFFLKITTILKGLKWWYLIVVSDIDQCFIYLFGQLLRTIFFAFFLNIRELAEFCCWNFEFLIYSRF